MPVKHVPSEDLLEKPDCCGLVSRREIDKVSLFSLFYGKLDGAPLIEECPINMECRYSQLSSCQHFANQNPGTGR